MDKFLELLMISEVRLGYYSLFAFGAQLWSQDPRLAFYCGVDGDLTEMASSERQAQVATHSGVV